VTSLSRLLASASLAAVVVLSGCGGGDDGDTPSPSAGTSPDASGSPTQAPGVRSGPPLEGPDRGPAATEKTDFREDPEWQLPEPGGLSPAPEDDDPIFSPPEDPLCPEGWTQKDKPSNGFGICYPADWEILGEGYVTAGAEDRWYSIGLFLFPGGDETADPLAHVSVYAIPSGARPMTYTRDCPKPYSIKFAGQDAVICPEFPDVAPREDFTSYHVRRGDTDYFIQVVPYEGGSEDDREMAIEIAHTFNLLEQPSP
jgi:hypothetical protein